MSLTNVSFTKLLKTGDRLREFNFRKLPNKENSYHVDVTDDRGQRIVFTMQPDAEGNWKIAEGDRPKWVYFSEDLLSNVLKEGVY
jgi:hypothetical protein